MSQRRLPPPCRYVYVIGPETGLQKIGIATDPRSRLAALQTASPLRLKIHASVAVPFGAAHDVERRAHEALRQVRAAGEWFDTTPEAAVAAVTAAAVGWSTGQPSTDALPLFDFVQHSREGRCGDNARLIPPQSTGLRTGLGRLWKVARRAAEGQLGRRHHCQAKGNHPNSDGCSDGLRHSGK